MEHIVYTWFCVASAICAATMIGMVLAGAWELVCILRGRR